MWEGGIRLRPRAPDAPSGRPAGRDVLLPLAEDSPPGAPDLEPVLAGQWCPLFSTCCLPLPLPCFQGFFWRISPSPMA